MAVVICIHVVLLFANIFFSLSVLAILNSAQMVMVASNADSARQKCLSVSPLHFFGVGTLALYDARRK